ncbi:TraX family protein [Paeniclostridium hominis]|uniref:TraX family protein n=1 Tax=Paeniclostridium hominis TaxID=2764329 RepID=UPI0022E03FD7|nr:TraX family protein [Paeniclostridium hominis]
MKKCIKIPIIVALCIFSTIGELRYVTILWILSFGNYRENFQKQVIGFVVISSIFIFTSTIGVLSNNASIWWEQFYQIGVLLAIPLLAKYNKSLGKYKNSKWIFYIFYPLNLLVLGYIKYYIL